MAAHAYWRMYCTACPSAGEQIEIFEFAFYDSTGTQIPTTGGTPSASSNYVPGTTDPANAFDGNVNTRWTSAGDPRVTPEWLQYQFASPADVSSISLACKENTPTLGPGTFQLQYSDNGSSWTTLWSFVGVGWPGSGGLVTLTFNAANAVPTSIAIYWRIHITLMMAAAFELQIGDILFKDGNGAPISTARYACSSSVTQYGYGPALAFDGDSTSWWDGGGGAPFVYPYDITYWFGDPTQVGTVCLVSRNQAQNFQNMPTNFDVQYSLDGVAWTTVKSVTGANWTGPGQTNCFSLGGAFPQNIINFMFDHFGGSHDGSTNLMI